MGRKPKFCVEYFPHFVKSSKTKRILDRYWGNDGYAFWFKLLEMLGAEDNHYLNLSHAAEWEDFLAFMLLDEETAFSIIRKLIELGKIDSQLWEEARVIWCQSLVDNLGSVYDKRKISAPEKPNISAFGEYPGQKYAIESIDGPDIPQSKVNKSIVHESKDSPLTPLTGGSENADTRREPTGFEMATGEPTQGSPSQTRDPQEDESGESLAVKMAASETNDVSHSPTRKLRKRANTGVLTQEQQEKFEIFYAAYPNKKSPGQAEKTFAKLNPSEELFKEILAGIERAKKHDRRFVRDDGTFAPYPSSWLNDRGWEDQFAEGGNNHGGTARCGNDPAKGAASFVPSSGFRGGK